MNKNVRTFIVLPLVGLAIFTGMAACNTVHSGGNPTPTELKKDVADMETSARIATRVYILTIDDPTDRAKTEKFAHDLAEQIVKGIGSSNLTIEQVRDYADSLINGSNLKHKQAVGLLLDSVAVVVEEKINTDLFNLQGDARTQAITELVKSACQGIMEATSFVPTTQP